MSACLAVAALGLLVLASGALGKPQPKERHYLAVFKIDKGKYRSAIQIGGNKKTTYNETDEFNGVAQYYKFAVPAKGPIPDFKADGYDPATQILADPDAWGATSWEAFGQGLNYSYDCNGNLTPKGTPKLKAQVDSADHELDIEIPLVDDIVPSHVHGGGNDNFNCDYYGQSAFVPAINDHDPNQFLEAIVGAKVKKLRNLQPGDHMDYYPTERNALVDLKDNCGNQYYTCNQHLNWSGTVRIFRKKG